MLRVLAACAGETAVILVSDTTVKLVAATVPKTTLVAPVKPVPVMVTVVPPDAGPEAGATPVTVGSGALQVKWSAAVSALVPTAVERTMLRMPAACAGETAVTLVSDTTVKLVAATVPKTTLVVPVKPAPVMVTVVPPDAGPEAGATPVTVGSGAL